jgi:M6 family metalloprotease-like protein
MTAAAVVAAVAVSAPSHAQPASTCTIEQNQTRQKALAAYKRGMAAARKAYFRTHKNPKLRAAFVRAQQKKLKTLKAAADCTVPPLPPSSNASCSLQLAQHPGNLLSEGPKDPVLDQQSVGRVDSVAIYLDYPDAPGVQGGPESYTSLFTPDQAWYDEVSYGRLAVSVTPVTRWIRMPQPTSAYVPTTGENLLRYLHDALAAADPYVDFSRFNHITFFNAAGFNSSLGYALSFPRAGLSGINVDGSVIRYGLLLGGAAATFPQLKTLWMHEESHVLGLPDTGGRTVGWDLTASPSGLSHLLGWHKWKLGWLDPSQLTCVSASGTIDETLTPMAVRGGKKLVVVPINDALAYAVEARKRIGYDRNACGEGVLVYWIDSRRSNYEDPIVTRGPLKCGSFTAGALPTGEVYEDEFVKVEVLATDGRNYRVRVTKK